MMQVEVNYLGKNINIGRYDENGIFTSKSWQLFLDSIGKICNSVRIYTNSCDEQVNTILSYYADIAHEDFPDTVQALKAYYLKCNSSQLWHAIKTCNFNIDTGIANIYFLKNDTYKAELNVDDDVNYIILNLSLEEKDYLGKEVFYDLL